MLQWEITKGTSPLFTLLSIEINTNLKGIDMKCTASNELCMCARFPGNKWCREREMTPREMSREAIFLGLHKKKKNVTFAKSYPKWPVAREVSHLINSGFSFMSYHLKTTSLPQCVQIFVSEARWPFHVVQLPQNHWLRNNDSLLTVMSTSFDTV